MAKRGKTIHCDTRRIMGKRGKKEGLGGKRRRRTRRRRSAL